MAEIEADVLERGCLDIWIDEIVPCLRDTETGEIKDPKDINDIRMKGNQSENHPGNFGHIKLAAPVFHVGFIDLIRKILVCVCYKCKEIIINDYDKFEEISKIKDSKKRFNK